MRMARLVVCSSILAGLCALNAQTDAGKVSGVITDPSGGAVANAAITIQNEVTGAERTTSTNAEGVYFLGQLPPAAYTLTANAQGLSSAEIKGINVQVGQER